MFQEKIYKKISEFLRKFKFLKEYIPVIGIIIVNLQLIEYIRFTESGRFRAIIYDIILNLIIIYFYKVISNQKKEIEKTNRYVENLKTKNECLAELDDSIRCFKHDFYNIIQAIDGYLLLGDMEALKKYFKKLLHECNYVKNLELLTSNAINNPAIYGVLLNKCKKAEEKNIDMNINVLMDFSNLGEKSYSLSRIIGILLDNAIEAALDCEEKLINVEFLQSQTNPVQRIRIENTYNEKEIDTSMIFEKNYSSKKEKGNSGLGLWKVRDLLGKESKIWLETTTDSKMFKQEIQINI